MRNNFKLGIRMALSYSYLMVIIVVLVGFAVFNMKWIQEEVKGIVYINSDKLELSNTMAKSVLIIGKNIRGIVLFNDAIRMNDDNRELEESIEKYNEAYQSLKNMPMSEAEKQLLDKIKNDADTARDINEQVIKLGLANQDAQAAEILIRQATPAIQQWIEDLDKYVEIQDNFNKVADAKVMQIYKNSLVLLLALGGIGIFLGIIIAFFITGGITGTITKIVSGLTKCSAQLAASATQLAATSQQLSRGSAEQASSIEEVSSTLQEALSMLQQNTENTEQAAALSGQVKESSYQGAGEMQEMVASMNEIKKSSDRIAKIIKIIDDIAFQTNLLALNAAIEAARAGEAGMGFAVVAEEVRNLALRSAQAAKDTASIIEANIEISGKGVAVAGRVHEVLAEITNEAKRVNQLMSSISIASQEQAQGVNQITTGMIQIETVTRQNAANAEESSSAADELNALANNMREIVGQLSLWVNGKITVLSKKTKQLKQGHRHGELSVKPMNTSEKDPLVNQRLLVVANGDHGAASVERLIEDSHDF
jgi:methyl-accepting chemotaxis protein